MDIVRMTDLCWRAADIEDQIVLLEAEQLTLSQRNVALNVELAALRARRMATRLESVTMMTEETGFTKDSKNAAIQETVDTGTPPPAVDTSLQADPPVADTSLQADPPVADTDIPAIV